MLKSSMMIRKALDEWTPEQRATYLAAYDASNWDVVYPMSHPYTETCCQLTANEIRGGLADAIRDGIESLEEYDRWLLS